MRLLRGCVAFGGVQDGARFRNQWRSVSCVARALLSGCRGQILRMQSTHFSTSARRICGRLHCAPGSDVTDLRIVAPVLENGNGVRATSPSARRYRIGSVGRSSPHTRDDLLLMYLPLVRDIVDRMRLTLPPCLDADDLHSVGLAGLVQAITKYTSDQESSFSAYAAMRIRGAILDELRRMDWMARGVRQKAKQMGDVVGALEQRLGRPATAQEIAEELSLSGPEYARLMEKMKPVVHLDLDAAKRDGADEATFHEEIADERQDDASAVLQHKELVQMLAGRMQRLSVMQQKVLAMYYFEELRLAEIAVVFGVTESRICQLHTQALRVLRGYLTSAFAT